MINNGTAQLKSSVGKKIVTGVTGLGLFVFVVAHLVGNLTIFIGAEAFNAYAHFLESLLHGGFIYIAEAGLILFFLSHIAAGIRIALGKKRARPEGYAVVASKGGPSRKTLSSRSMVITGAVILVFVVLHVKMFKYGPGESDGYIMAAHGQEVRDLYRLVVEEFNKLDRVVLYVAAMLLLGLHLRHGFWSAFQSLGANNPRVMPFLYGAGLMFAVALAVGFLFIPVYIFFFIDPAEAASRLHGGGA